MNPPHTSSGPAGEHSSPLQLERRLSAYDAAADTSVRWNDAALGIDWPVAQPLLSGKDERAPLLAEIDPARLPVYAA